MQNLAAEKLICPSEFISIQLTSNDEDRDSGSLNCDFLTERISALLSLGIMEMTISYPTFIHREVINFDFTISIVIN